MCWNKSFVSNQTARLPRSKGKNQTPYFAAIKEKSAVNSRKEAKQKIYRHLETMLRARVEEARLAIKATREARDTETKSSAGDKHETARALMQIELENKE